VSGHPSAAGRAQDRESTSAKDRRSTTEPTPPTLICLYHAPFPRYYHLFPKIKRRHVTVTTPTQGTVCNPSAKTSYGEPVYKISGRQKMQKLGWFWGLGSLKIIKNS